LPEFEIFTEYRGFDLLAIVFGAKVVDRQGQGILHGNELFEVLELLGFRCREASLSRFQFESPDVVGECFAGYECHGEAPFCLKAVTLVRSHTCTIRMISEN